MKEKLFIETDLRLDNAVNFSQYIIRTDKLITIIGELHMREFICPEPRITVADYCLQSVKKNIDCYILSEYHDGHDPLKQGSKEIVSTHIKFEKHHLLDRIIPVDVRGFIMKYEDYRGLYHNPDFYRTYNSKTKIFTSFFLPFFEKKDIFLSDKNHYYKEEYDELTNYHNNLNEEFKKCYTDLKKGDKYIHKKLRHLWMKVADFFVLKYFYTNDGKDYILVIGDYHRSNLQEILDKFKFAKCIVKKNPDNTKCVNLYEAITFLQN